MAIFSSSVIWATSSLARSPGESAVFIHGRSVDLGEGAADAAAGTVSDANANTSTNTLTTRKVLFFIEAPFCDGLRRASARRCRRSWAAAGEGVTGPWTGSTSDVRPSATERPVRGALHCRVDREVRADAPRRCLCPGG